MKVDPDTRSPARTRLARVLGIHTDERTWRRGANGERATAPWLGRLPEGWYLFHDVPVGERGTNIEHVVIGPGGVFTINTRNVTGKLWVGPRSIRHNGHPTDFLSKAIAEARRASRLLSAAVGRSVDVRGVLAILADEWTIREEPADVFVRAPRGAKNLMLRQPVVLSIREVNELAAASAKPATWSADPRSGSGRRTRPLDA
jgi:hypothetical protein